MRFSRFFHVIFREMLFPAAFLCLWLVVAGAAHAQTFVVPVNPTATYLRVSDQDKTDGPVLDSVPFSLVAAGINPGDVLRFDVLGGYSFAIGQPDVTQDTIAVFSTSSTLLPPSQRFRVPGAVSAGATFATVNTFFENLVTDIPEDFNFGFRTPGGLTLMVPQGARFLFFSVASSAYSDNRDPNGDYASRLTLVSRALVPEPGTCALLTTGLLPLAGVLVRRRRKTKA